MFGLKGAYLYLVAVQITLIKFFKKIYFTTNYYNNSLLTKIPNQIFYNPNPFLLSIISPYKKKTFKINEINPNDFWLENNRDILKKNHNFFWLNLIDRKIDVKNIRKIIYLWLLRYSRFKKKIWENSTLSSRVISWLLNIDIIINNASFEFKRKFFENIISQCNHLKKNIKYEKDLLKKIEILTALILSGLVFKDYKENFDFGLKDLEKFVKTYFDNDGFPLSRNPDDLIFLSKYLLLCAENIKDAQEYVPEFLEDIIKKNLACVKFINAPGNINPLFNGGSENNLELFDDFIEKSKLSQIKEKTIGGLFYAKSKSQIIYFDVGSPPGKNFSRNYQSGPLSFEYFLDGLKIITNCGFGKNTSSKAELISRFTASQSTLTINDTSINKFERNKLVNRIFGNSIKDTFKVTELNFENNKNLIGCISTHNGYEKKFGCIHTRELSIDKLKGNLSLVLGLE